MRLAKITGLTTQFPLRLADDAILGGGFGGEHWRLAHKTQHKNARRSRANYSQYS